VNLEKCLVSLRNRRLTALVADRIGVTTSKVYAVLLRLLSRTISRCRADTILEIMGRTSETDQDPGQGVTTADILNQLDISIDLSRGIGKASESHIDQRLAEALHPQRPDRGLVFNEAHVVGDASSDELEETDSSDASDTDFAAPVRVNGAHTKSRVNGAAKHGSLYTDRALGRGDRLSQLRQHLLLLCEGEQKFVRHSAFNQWTVDFQPLLYALQNSELDTVIESTSGRHGLRLARILRSKGKLDEKSLPSIALMKKADVQNKMLEMQMAGFVDIQEVPRDNNRTANRTMFLWFSDSERCLDQLLENTYKSMLRTLQNLLVQRRHNREVLGLAERKDVRGREEEIMETGTYNAFVMYRDIEGRLLNQLMRLDDLVAVLRDY
jgi:DNA-directed RNA polymerase III subunit RPC3